MTEFDYDYSCPPAWREPAQALLHAVPAEIEYAGCAFGSLVIKRDPQTGRFWKVQYWDYARFTFMKEELGVEVCIPAQSLVRLNKPIITRTIEMVLAAFRNRSLSRGAA